jgi:hypothetical protein
MRAYRAHDAEAWTPRLRVSQVANLTALPRALSLGARAVDVDTLLRAQDCPLDMKYRNGASQER